MSGSSLVAICGASYTRTEGNAETQSTDRQRVQQHWAPFLLGTQAFKIEPFLVTRGQGICCDSWPRTMEDKHVLACLEGCTFTPRCILHKEKIISFVTTPLSRGAQVRLDSARVTRSTLTLLRDEGSDCPSPILFGCCHTADPALAAVYSSTPNS